MTVTRRESDWGQLEQMNVRWEVEAPYVKKGKEGISLL